MNRKAVNSIVLLTLMLCPLIGQAQGNIPVLSWRSHFSYRSVIDITTSAQRIYAASENSLFFVDREELSINRLTKNDGLSDVGIGAIGYESQSDILVVAYTNGNIDLVGANNITNLNAFREANVIGSKQIRDITFNNGLAYLSGDQGVLVIDLEQKEITESYQNLGMRGSDLAVFGTSFFQDSIYATTSQGILSASLATTVNRQDFNNWQRTLTNRMFTEITSNGASLTASSTDQLYQFDGISWTPSLSIGSFIEALFFNGAALNVLTGDALLQVSGNSISTLLNLTQSEGTARDFFVDGTDIWIGDGLNGLTRYQGETGVPFFPSGPANDENWRFSLNQEQVTLLHGGHSESLNTLGRSGEISRFSAESGWEISDIAISDSDMIFDLVDLETLDEEDPTLYLASFDRGLIAVNEGQSLVVNENSSNSTLTNPAGSVRMTALARESQLLWMTNYGTETPLHSWDPVTDTWTAYRFSNSLGSFPIDLYIAPNGDKWMPIDPERGGGILVFNETDNRERYLNTNGGQGGLPGRTVTSLVLDDDFFLWVGTNEGIAFYPNLNSILDGTALSASVPIFENRLLLRDEFITAIAVDPGNRKWFGTRTNGLWLFSETGEEQIYHFTAENSPLPSNQIDNLFIERQTGELFIGTDRGTVSFRSDATEGTNTHENVTIYPNPARSSSVTEIVINGLVNNALVKITDVSGKLVREIRSQGSTALWNARDYNGQTVKTGVYLVFSSNADGTETFVGKIAVI